MTDATECIVATIAENAALSEMPTIPEEQLPAADGSGDCATVSDPFCCQICSKRFQQPRVLSCLHVFCSGCLDRLVEDRERFGDGDATVGSKTTPGRMEPADHVALVCPTCRQETRAATVAELPLDVVVMNAMDMSDISASRIRCTSCKADEKAVARCSDCASFLCGNCVIAHKYMRCFENHKVTNFCSFLVIYFTTNLVNKTLGLQWCLLEVKGVDVGIS